MYCLYCGKEISDDEKFCPFCGNKVKVPKSKKEVEVIEEDPQEAKSKLYSPGCICYTFPKLLRKKAWSHDPF